MVKSLRKATTVFAISILLIACTNTQHPREKEAKDTSTVIESSQKITLPKHVNALQQSYGHHFTIIDSNQIVCNDGDTLRLDDGKIKNATEALEETDIEDQFRCAYPTGSEMIPIDSNFDPGRYRNQLFFQKMYGTTEEEVKQNLDTIHWMETHDGTDLLVNKVNGCKDSLQKVSNALSLLPDSLLKYVVTTAGVFNYRKIAGTTRLSCHSYGIAIDINTKYAHYWRWAVNKGVVEYKNNIPYEIVRIFEKYGFIWGGYWYHYDTMHFEFRPELLKYKA